MSLTSRASYILRMWSWLAARSENTCESYKSNNFRRPLNLNPKKCQFKYGTCIFCRQKEKNYGPQEAEDRTTMANPEEQEQN